MYVLTITLYVCLSKYKRTSVKHHIFGFKERQEMFQKQIYVPRKEWLDIDLLTCYLKIDRDHKLIEGNPCTKFGIDQLKGSKYIERTPIGMQTDRPTHIKTDIPNDNMSPF